MVAGWLGSVGAAEVVGAVGWDAVTCEDGGTVGDCEGATGADCEVGAEGCVATGGGDEVALGD